MFGLELGGIRPSGSLPPIFSGPCRMLATARGALSALIRLHGPRTVWLPSYLCPVVLPCCEGRHRFYPIGRSLEIEGDGNGWMRDVAAGDLVVFIAYFGFRTWDTAAAAVRARGAWVVEDASQALLNTAFSPHAHYVITSPRKFVGVPDGSILLAQDAPLPDDRLPPAPDDWWLAALQASTGRRVFDLAGGDRAWFDLFRATEAAGPVAPSRMSDLSRLLLEHTVDWEECARRRRVNYGFMLRHLAPFALFDTLPDYVVPLGFPVRLPRREAARDAMFAQQIFPPVHWPLGSAVPAEFAASHRLAAELLTLPIDQRCGQPDLERIVAAVRATQP